MAESRNVMIVVGGLVVAFLYKRMMDGASGPGEAANALGDTMGGFLDFGGDIADGVASRTGDAADFAGGGLADAIRVPGTLAEDAYNIAGDGLDFGLGGSADVIRNVDAPEIQEPDYDGDGEPGGNLTDRFL